MTSKPSLPIDALLPEILSSLQRHPNLVLEAAPGAGKTTRIPPELLKLDDGEVIFARTVLLATGAEYNRPALANLEAFKEKAGLSADEFEGLLQYTSQVCDFQYFRAEPAYSRQGFEQPGELQIIRVY